MYVTPALTRSDLHLQTPQPPCKSACPAENALERDRHELLPMCNWHASPIHFHRQSDALDAPAGALTVSASTFTCGAEHLFCPPLYSENRKRPSLLHERCHRSPTSHGRSAGQQDNAWGTLKSCSCVSSSELVHHWVLCLPENTRTHWKAAGTRTAGRGSHHARSRGHEEPNGTITGGRESSGRQVCSVYCCRILAP